MFTHNPSVTSQWKFAVHQYENNVVSYKYLQAQAWPNQKLELEINVFWDQMCLLITGTRRLQNLNAFMFSSHINLAILDLWRP